MLRKEIYDQFSVFSSVSDQELEFIDSKVCWFRLPKGMVLFSNGDSSSDFYLIGRGAVRVTTYSFSGKEVAYQDLDAGKVFGELSAIDTLPRTTGIVAVTDCSIGKVSSKHFWELMEINPVFMRNIVYRLADLVRFLVGRVYEYSAMNVKDRIRAELVKLAMEASDGTNQSTIENVPTHEGLANRLATHREAVTKELSYLHRTGYIHKRGKKIIVPDIEKLTALIKD